jgi:Ca-activated chloride channel family protein
VGAGPESGYSDELRDTVTDEGRGAYVYLDEPAEASAIFGARFSESLEVAARGVQVELDLPWYMQMQHFSGEEYSSDPTDVQPQHLAPDDAMVFLQTLHACDTSVVQPNDPVGVTVTWDTPITHAKQSLTTTTTVGALVQGDAKRLAKAKAIVAYAEALKSRAPEDVATAQVRVAEAQSFGPDAELDEINELLGYAAMLAD